ncbi:MAG: radical SAM protein [Gammaproteobacteria bacterium]|nr:MAG: radical SAM protein [Gammaproteobacteria bacterium]
MSQDILVYDIEDRRYINLNSTCTLKCQFCPKTQGHPIVNKYDLTLHEKKSVDDYIAALGDPKKYNEVVFCGFGEPTLRLKELLAISHWIKNNGGKVRVNTDGLANLVYKRNILPELGECVDAISISMNAQNEDVYNKHCQPAMIGSYQAMLEFIELAPKYIADVTASAIEGLEGVDIEACEKLAQERNVKFKKRVLDNVG